MITLLFALMLTIFSPPSPPNGVSRMAPVLLLIKVYTRQLVPHPHTLRTYSPAKLISSLEELVRRVL